MLSGKELLIKRVVLNKCLHVITAYPIWDHNGVRVGKIDLPWQTTVQGINLHIEWTTGYFD